MAVRPGHDSAALAGKEDDAGQRRGEVSRPQIVDLVFNPADPRLEYRADHRQGENPQRQIDIEDPAPGEMLHQPPAEQRPDHRRQAKHPAEQPLIAPAIGRWDHVAHHRHGHYQQTAATQSLQCPHQDQLRHVLRQSAQHRTEQKHHDGDLQHDLAAEQIAELAIQRHHDGRGQQIGRHDPGQILQPAELADDGRQRGRDDGLIERRQQHHQQQRGEQQTDRGRLFRRPAAIFVACGVINAHSSESACN
ncbi:hypothetical protein D3C79_593150 [compost metagenome]